MNVIEINPQGGTAITNLSQYVALTLPLTVVTALVIIVFQGKYIFSDGIGLFKRFGWPAFITDVVSRKRLRGKYQDQPPLGVVAER